MLGLKLRELFHPRGICGICSKWKSPRDQ